MTEDPFSTPASAPGINKIPFLVFDAILVITALALAFSAQGPLSPLAFFWILLCVAAGGLISCLPFWIEFRDRVRLRQYEIREQQGNAQDSQWQYMEARLAEQADALQKLSLRMAETAERLSALEARPQAPDMETLAALCANLAEKQSLTVREELLAAATQQIDATLGSQEEENARHFTAQESAITRLRKDNSAAEAALRRLETKIEEIALLVTTATAAQSQPLATAAETEAETENTATATEVETNTGAAADSDPNFAADGSAPAPAPAETAVKTEPQAEAEPQVEAEAETETETPPDAAPSASVEDTASAEDAAASTAIDALATAANTAPVAEPDVKKASASLQPALLETPEPPTRAKPSANKDKTTLVAQVLIGIGNKPYVRGTGPGLSLDKGVPMQFVEIGKWEWVSPNGHDPVSIQIYKNDEIPSTIGEITIEPGQRRAVTPTFPK